jgi:hypothetical protein
MADIPIDNNEMRDKPVVAKELIMDESLALDNENMIDRTEECVPDTVGSSESGAADKSDSQEESSSDPSQPYVVERRKEERDKSYRRRHERTGFTYPLELKIFSSKLTNISFIGYIEDISLSGAGINFEDRYGMVQIDGLSDSRVKLLIRMPHGDDIVLLSTIRWIRRDMNEKMIVKVGIQFQRLEDWQLKTVNQLISLKNKDQNMMWNLFENYEKNIR